MSALLSTREVAVFLGVSSGRVLQMVKSGELRPHHSVTGIRGGISRQFVRADVEACREARRAGRAGVAAADVDLCQRAFRLFDAKATLVRCVAELGVAPHVVRKLYREWLTPLGAELAPLPEEKARAMEQEERAAAAAFEADMRARRQRADEELRARLAKPADAPRRRGLSRAREKESRR